MLLKREMREEMFIRISEIKDNIKKVLIFRASGF